jgi:hypothetical protein
VPASDDDKRVYGSNSENCAELKLNVCLALKAPSDEEFRIADGTSIS